MAIQDAAKKKTYLKEYLALSAKETQELAPLWTQVLKNYLVDTPHSAYMTTTAFPLAGPDQTSRSIHTSQRRIKDSETKVMVDSLAAAIMLPLFGQENYIVARKEGREDAYGAATVTRLLLNLFDRHDSYRVLFGAIKHMLLFGTGLVKGVWHYEEAPRVLRDFDVDREGFPISTGVMVPYPVFDDAKLTSVDPMRFFPEPGVDNMGDMKSCAEAFFANMFDATDMVERELWDREAVQRALDHFHEGDGKEGPLGTSMRNRPDQPKNTKKHSALKTMMGIEYFGIYPFAKSFEERWRIITMWGEEIVRDVPFFEVFDEPILPFYDFTVGWLPGRFWGQSPAADARCQQEILDFMATKAVQAVSRMVSPPVIYDAADEHLNKRKLATWSPDVLVPAENPDAVKTLSYSANIQAAFAIMADTRQRMREGSSATEPIAGLPQDIRRAPATGVELQFRSASARPEMVTQYLERGTLRRMGRGLFSVIRRGLAVDDPELMDAKLRERIGDVNAFEPVDISQLSGEWDLNFTGSRKYLSKSEQIQYLRLVMEIVSMNPQVGSRIDMEEFVIHILEAGGMDAMAQKIVTKDPMQLLENVALQQALGSGVTSQANGNGANFPRPNGAVNAAQANGSLVPLGQGTL